MKNEYLSAWIDEAANVPSKLNILFKELTEEQLNRKPAADKWSIGQLLDHIIVTNEQYFPILERVISGTHKNPFLSRFRYIPDFFGKTILKSVEPETQTKLQTVKKFRPASHVFTLNKIEELKNHQNTLIDFAKASDALDHREVIVTSPVASYIVYSLENTFRIILSHELRHINQASLLRQTSSARVNVT